MLKIKILCVGKLKERYFESACAEYIKRLSAYAEADVEEIKEARLPASPSEEQIKNALIDEGRRILEAMPKGAFSVALCVEGEEPDSGAFAAKLALWQVSGGKLCFAIGGSNGLSDEVKKSAGYRLSLSKMTFPHHLARVILLEQLYRAFQINLGGKYHK